MRKIIIGLSAIGLVASLFWLYALIMDTEPIEIQDVSSSDNLAMPESNDTVKQVGDSDVRVAKEARYVVLNPETKEFSRVFGFEKLLSQGMDTSRRQVENPYMIFYESDYQCRIDADMGMFQINTSGASSTPKDARLNGNVKIHITPQPDSSMSEIVITMDDLVFSSERSEFATDKKVHIQSEQVELKGAGLIIIFDSAAGKIVFLRIRDLEEIHLQDIKKSKSQKTIASEKPSSASPHEASCSVQPPDESDAVSDETVKAEELPSTLDYYRCMLEDNVKIKYGDEIIVSGAEEINILNILFSKLDQEVSSDKDSMPAEGDSKSAVKPKSQPEQRDTETTTKSATEIIINCDGGITLEPMESSGQEHSTFFRSVSPNQIYEITLRPARLSSDIKWEPDVRPVYFAEAVDLSVEEDSDEIRQDNSEEPPSNQPLPTKFEARSIDYDLHSGSGTAHGPVRFTFYQQPDPNSVMVPIVVTADENARFLADTSKSIEQVVFNGNVMTTREFQTSGLTQLDNLHSEKLTIDLAESETGTLGLDNLRMTDGKVYVESQRIHEGRKISDIKLYCREISYDQAHDIILAKGPGKIELVNNEQPQSDESDPANPMSRPCVAMVDGFTEIRWNMDQQTILANGKQDVMKLAYYPIIDGQVQKQIFVYSMQLEISYLTRPSEIHKVFTDKSIIYEEWDSDMTKRLHYIVGQTLDYDRINGGGWMNIKGTPAVPCNVDGVRMPEVFVHPVTGQIKASISTTPGIFKSR
jgi:hypothetical protein